jgi:hypothetical protein
LENGAFSLENAAFSFTFSALTFDNDDGRGDLPASVGVIIGQLKNCALT